MLRSRRCAWCFADLQGLLPEELPIQNENKKEKQTNKKETTQTTTIKKETKRAIQLLE